MRYEYDLLDVCRWTKEIVFGGHGDPHPESEQRYLAFLEMRLENWQPAPKDAYSEAVAALVKASIEILKDSIAHQEFRWRKQAWEEETRFVSNTTEILGNEHFQAIIALGKPVIPYLLESILLKPSLLYKALSAITNGSTGPLTPQPYGDIASHCAAWLEWGRTNNV